MLGGMRPLLQCIVVIQGQRSGFCRCFQGEGAQTPFLLLPWVREWYLTPIIRAEV